MYIIELWFTCTVHVHVVNTELYTCTVHVHVHVQYVHVKKGTCTQYLYSLRKLHLKFAVNAFWNSFCLISCWILFAYFSIISTWYT